MLIPAHRVAVRVAMRQFPVESPVIQVIVEG